MRCGSFHTRDNTWSSVRTVSGTARYPRDNKARFDEVKDQLAKYFSEMAGRTISAGAVDNQLAFAVTGQRELTNAGFARNFILNAAAALEVGFTSSADLPGHIVLRES